MEFPPMHQSQFKLPATKIVQLSLLHPKHITTPQSSLRFKIRLKLFTINSHHSSQATLRQVKSDSNLPIISSTISTYNSGQKVSGQPSKINPRNHRFQRISPQPQTS